MSTSTRRVRRVRLAAPRHDLVRRGQVLLEDALHTASIPAADGGRLLLVRALDVGRIHPDAPPSTLALAIEARLREVQLTAVHADDAAAPAAGAVFFRDAAEACALLAARLASGAPADAWFWKPAVPGWRPGTPADEGMRLALRAAAASPQGAAAVAEVLRRVAARGGADRLLAATLTTSASALLGAYGWTAAVPVDGDAPEPVPSEWRPLLSRWIATWGADDVRSLWLAATVLIAERPSRVADRTLPSRAAALVRAVELATLTTIDRSTEAAAPPPAPTPSPSPDPPSAARPESAAADPAEPRAAAERERAADDAPPPPAEQPRSDSVDAHPHAPAPEDDAHPPIPDLHPQIDADPAPTRPAGEVAREDDSHPHAMDRPRSDSEARAADEQAAEAHQPEAPQPVESPRPRERAEQSELVPTEAGGLFFLVAAMERLGMGEVVDRHPALLEADLPGRVLLRVAERTRVPADDPAVRCLEDARDAGETGARYAFQAPAVLARAAAHAREAPLAWEDAALDAVVEAWVTALRRFCRRHARVGLWDVVRRPGRMAFTRTHVDVTFALRGADVRIRAAGLDVDPGWVPWLGRVIAYHFTD